MGRAKIEKVVTVRNEGIKIIKQLQKAGHYALFVGGCVRDKTWGLAPKDYDIVTSATPDQVKDLFSDVKPIGEQFGVMLVNKEFEVATFRTDTYKGSELEVNLLDPKTHSLEELVEKDSAKRDFTINAIYEDPISERIYDPQEGLRDLASKKLIFIGSSQTRLEEDPIRLLRMFRFIFKYSMDRQGNLYSHRINLSYLLKRVSKERLFQEATKVLLEIHKVSYFYFALFIDTLSVVISELQDLFDVNQDPKWHPEGDVLTHTYLTIKNLRIRTEETVWSALLHDIGKKSTFAIINNQITTRGHEKVGAKISEKILRDLKCSNKFIDEVTYIVKNHMRIKEISKMKSRKVMNQLNDPYYLTLKEVSCADSQAGSGDLSWWLWLNDFEQSEKRKTFDEVAQRKITGKDLIDAGLKPCPEFKDILKACEDISLEHPGLTKQGVIKQCLWERTNEQDSC